MKKQLTVLLMVLGSAACSGGDSVDVDQDTAGAEQPGPASPPSPSPVEPGAPAQPQNPTQPSQPAQPSGPTGGGVLPLHQPDFAAGVTDSRPVAESPVKLPAAGGSFVDPDFKTKIIRVTDASAMSPRMCVNSYAYVPAFNLTTTRLVVACGNVGRLYRFDPATDAVTYQGTLTDGAPVDVNWQSAFWSGTSPDVLFALGGDQGAAQTKLYAVDVTKAGAARFTVVRDFAGLQSGRFDLWQLGKSDDDNVFTFHTRAGGAQGKVVAYLRATDQVVVFPESGFVFDESQVNKSGKHIIVTGQGPNAYQIKVWDPVANKIVRTLANNQADGTGGHYDLGAQLMVNSDRYRTGVVVRDFNGLAPTNVLRYLTTSGAPNWGIADHLSMRNADERYFVGSTYGGGGAPFAGEIYIGRTDGKGFLRIAHTRSRQTADAYWSEPRASVDRSGRYIAFSSDNGTAQIDVFIARVP